MDEQLEKIRDDVKDAISWRQNQDWDNCDSQVLYSYLFIFEYLSNFLIL